MTFSAIDGLMTRIGLPQEAIDPLVVSWLEQQDVRGMENLVELQWLQDQIHVMDRDSPAPRTFSVTWSGLVRAPADGAYTFSLCPLDLDNDRIGYGVRKQTTAIWIGGQQVLDSTAAGWTCAPTR